MGCTKRFLMVAVMAACAFTPAFAEELRELDASGGASDGHWVMFASQRNAEDPGTGTAILAAGKGGEQAISLGSIPTEGAAVLKGVSAEAVATLRASAADPTTKTTLVKITGEQFATITAVVKRFAGEKNEYETPDQIIVNAAIEVVKALEFKAPYRSRRTTTQDYFEDVGTLNRSRT